MSLREFVEARDEDWFNILDNVTYTRLCGNHRSYLITDNYNQEDIGLIEISSIILTNILVCNKITSPFSNIVNKLPQFKFIKKWIDDTEVQRIISAGINISDRFCKGDWGVFNRVLGFTIYCSGIILDTEIDKDRMYKLIPVMNEVSKSIIATFIDKKVNSNSRVKVFPYFGEPSKIFKGIDLVVDDTMYQLNVSKYPVDDISYMKSSYLLNYCSKTKYPMSISNLGVVNLLLGSCDLFVLDDSKDEILKVNEYLFIKGYS